MRLILAILVLSSSVAWADPPALPDKVPMEVQGQKGVWIRTDTLNHMTTDLQAYKLCQKSVTLLTEKLTLREVEIQTLLDAGKIDLEQQAKYKMAAEAEQKRADDLTVAMGRWYRQPVVWFIVGVGATVMGILAVKDLTK